MYYLCKGFLWNHSCMFKNYFIFYAEKEVLTSASCRNKILKEVIPYHCNKNVQQKAIKGWDSGSHTLTVVLRNCAVLWGGMRSQKPSSQRVTSSSVAVHVSRCIPMLRAGSLYTICWSNSSFGLVRIPEIKSNITGRKIPSSAYLCGGLFCTVFSKLAQLDMVHGAGHGSLGKCL